jgi:hypothetical protein
MKDKNTRSRSRTQPLWCTSIAAERRMPNMHWRWRRRGRDIVSLLEFRFGSVLPEDDAGRDAAELLAQHYLRLNVGAERVTGANLRLWAPWLREKGIARVIGDAKKAKTPSAVQLGKQWRVSADEVAACGLTTIRAFTVTLENDRGRQNRRRRKAGATKKRGRPSMGLSAEEKKARTNAQSAARMRKRRALRKKSHAPSYIEGIERDEFSVTDLSVTLSQTSILLPTSLDVRRAPQARRWPVPNEAIVMPELVEAELLPETKIIVPKQPDVIDLIPIEKAGRAWARRLPIHPGMRERYQAQGGAMFGSSQL